MIILELEELMIFILLSMLAFLFSALLIICAMYYLNCFIKDVSNVDNQHDIEDS